MKKSQSIMILRFMNRTWNMLLIHINKFIYYMLLIYML